jgi:hypothetical protein
MQSTQSSADRDTIHFTATSTIYPEKCRVAWCFGGGQILKAGQKEPLPRAPCIPVRSVVFTFFAILIIHSTALHLVETCRVSYRYGKRFTHLPLSFERLGNKQFYFHDPVAESYTLKVLSSFKTNKEVLFSHFWKLPRVTPVQYMYPQWHEDSNVEWRVYITGLPIIDWSFLPLYDLMKLLPHILFYISHLHIRILLCVSQNKLVWLLVYI